METTNIASLSLLHLVLLLLSSLISPSQGATICHSQDRNALLKIKEALNNPTSYPLGSWDPKTDCCSWGLVWCDTDHYNGRVTNVNIFNVTGVPPGHISPAIGDLTYLDTIYMDGLNLVGTIPSTITKLKRLSFLSLMNNQLSGPIPVFLNQLKELTALRLSSNNLSGTLPPTLSKLPKLLTLLLDHNNLAGPIPESWGKFAGVTPNFDLSHNSLSGPLPKSMGDVYDYYSIDLSFNNFVGDASFLFGKNKSLGSIYLNSNSFEFDFSKAEFPEPLNGLLIDHNRIYGSLPQGLAELTFYEFDVSHNDLCGPIPQGGNLQSFNSSAFDNNKCLCNAPLAPCKKIAAARSCV